MSGKMDEMVKSIAKMRAGAIENFVSVYLNLHPEVSIDDVELIETQSRIGDTGNCIGFRWFCRIKTEESDIRTQLAAMTAERDRLREAIEKVLFQVLHIENTGEVLVADIIAMREYLKPVLESEASNDSAKPKKTMTQREWDLRHANPYDLSDPNQPRQATND